MLKLRILTALVLIPLTLFILFYLSPWQFALVTTLVTFIAGWEWTSLMGFERIIPRLIYLLVLVLFFVSSFFLPMILILMVGCIWWVVAFGLVLSYPYGWFKHTISVGLQGILVLLPCWAALNYIRNQVDGSYALLFLFILIWGADTCAYFIGRKWGKTKLAPRVSPGKTWQGFFAALAFAVVSAITLQWIEQVEIKLWPWGILLAIIVVLFSVVGDLFESGLKRQADIKDSSKLLPGHGGLLDRIDSLTAASPIFAIGATLLGMYLS